jgi:hypothetical protein
MLSRAGTPVDNLSIDNKKPPEHYQYLAKAE